VTIAHVPLQLQRMVTMRLLPTALLGLVCLAAVDARFPAADTAVSQVRCPLGSC